MTDKLDGMVEAINLAIGRAKVFDDGSDGADAESARSIVAILQAIGIEALVRDAKAVSALSDKWQKEIDQYDAVHIGSSDPEDWVGPKRDCLVELRAAMESSNK